MASYRVDDIRTVALVGHEQAGKTSLADALLFKAKASDRRGSVDDGTSVSDFDEEEKKHKYSIDSSLHTWTTRGSGFTCSTGPASPISSARRSAPSARSFVRRGCFPLPRGCGSTHGGC